MTDTQAASSGLRRRFATFTASRGQLVDPETRTAKLSFSSETPVDMPYGPEVLDHSPGAMRVGKRQQHLPLLFNHNMDDLLGSVDSVAVEQRRGVAMVRFGKDPRGDWAMRQVQDGTLKNVSFMYRVHRSKLAEDGETAIAQDWEPYEISLVTVPADASVGVGRSLLTLKGNSMDTETLSRSERRRAAAAETEAALATEGERTRISEIDAMARRFNLPADVRQRMISDGTSVEDARAATLELVQRRTPAEPLEPAQYGQRDYTATGAGVSPRELKNYSLFRAIRALSLQDVRAKREAGFEMEVSAALAARLPTEAKGFCVPGEIVNPLGRRAQRTPLYAGTTGAGLVENELLAAAYIEPQYTQPRVLSAGATVLSGLVGNVLIPKMTASDSVAWLAAEGGTYNNTQPTLAQVSLNPSDVAAYVDLTRRLLQQSTPAAEAIIRDDLSRVISIAIDAAAIDGAGTGGVPLGILNQSGIGTVAAGVNGGSVTYAIIGSLVGQLAAANALYGRLTWLTTGGLAAHMMSTAKFSYGSATLWEPPLTKEPQPGEGSIMYMPSFISNNCPSNGTKGTGTNLQTLLLGNWTDLLIGQWGVLQILADPYSQSSSGTVRLTAIQTVGVAVRHPASFAVCSDLTLT